ncbi:uncharacterized protein LY89DRAFT_281924 [Mollisia scopiformis]|uniref:Uncharacterized protein n=1 Tax=Mollisia scopiformis TaxID=149040 RepID=A0A132BA53_MOLSC|nr:uncharacterized protein LY89DRAFT_281924 [Mollisia scopiformis]KUJ09261.1 hypothetical protein LY89DRAFT_281924 [Mollisia scopiformis]
MDHFRDHAPKEVRALEVWDKSLNLAEESRRRLWVNTAQGAEVCSVREMASRTRPSTPRTEGDAPYGVLPAAKESSVATPLAVHLYCGFEGRFADTILGEVLSVFARPRLESLHFSSEPNNLKRRPLTRLELYKAQFSSNPWRHLLPSVSPANETLKRVSLDCSLFWSEFAYVLPHLHALERLNCGLTCLRFEPEPCPVPIEWETREQAHKHILDACLNNRVEKTQDKKWIQITKDGIVLPNIEPHEQRVLNEADSMFYQFPWEEKVSIQFHEGLLQRSRERSLINTLSCNDK